MNAFPPQSAAHSQPAPAAPIRWIAISGGICRFGDTGVLRPVRDLLVAATPLTRAQIHHRHDGEHDRTRDQSEDDMPLTGITYAGAVQFATAVGGRLPTSLEWEWFAAGPHARPYPWGATAWTPAHARLSGAQAQEEPTGPAAVGGHPAGATPEGLLDLAGNVWEWTASPVMGQGRVIRGGSYASKPLYARTTFRNAVPEEHHSHALSVRPVRTP